MFITILGRQSGLALAELESLYGAEAIRPLGNVASIVDAPLPAEELGGSIKLAVPLATLPNQSLGSLSRRLGSELTQLVAELPEGKVRLGLSAYGLPFTAANLQRAALSLKTAVTAAGRSVRVVPNTATSLSSAQALHNQLTGPTGIELLLIADGADILMARTVREQNIEAYAARDHGRPYRDARVGMLPPKLAQIMIHLAMPHSDEATRTILDPFCGTGVVLQEAALYGYRVYGTDLSERMVRYSEGNLDWLAKKSGQAIEACLETADATTATWQPPIDAVVCEGYLGEPLAAAPARERLESIVHDCNRIARDFLANLAPQLTAGTPLCLALPAWHLPDDIRRLPVLDDLESLGYNRRDFIHATRANLTYHREGQIVGRDIVVLARSHHVKG